MLSFTNDVMRDLLSKSLNPASLTASGWKDTGKGPGSHEGDFIEWLPIHDQAQSVLDDVRRIKTHPLVPASIPIYGYIFDVKTGLLNEVPEATAAGKAGSR